MRFRQTQYGSSPSETSWSLLPTSIWAQYSPNLLSEWPTTLCLQHCRASSSFLFFYFLFIYLFFGLLYFPCKQFQRPKKNTVRMIENALVLTSSLLSCSVAKYPTRATRGRVRFSWNFEGTGMGDSWSQCSYWWGVERVMLVISLFIFLPSSGPQLHGMLSPTFRVGLSSH